MKLLNVETLIVVIIIGILLSLYFVPYDDTDDVKNHTRSGFSLYTDYGTGCQYLRAGIFGGLIPRVDGKGNHIGCKQ